MHEGTVREIKVPETNEQFDQVRSLMRAFVAWHQERHKDQMDLVTQYFDGPAFESELAGLPGKYGPPKGCLLIATVGTLPAGCVALRRIGDVDCEMKRMFVAAEFQGQGIGKALANEIIDRARGLGYSRMVLDSGAKQFEAHTLYRGLGFVDIGPYYSMPDEMANWLVFMELVL